MHATSCADIGDGNKRIVSNSDGIPANFGCIEVTGHWFEVEGLLGQMAEGTVNRNEGEGGFAYRSMDAPREKREDLKVRGSPK